MIMKNEKKVYSLEDLKKGIEGEFNIHSKHFLPPSKQLLSTINFNEHFNQTPWYVMKRKARGFQVKYIDILPPKLANPTK
jgi:hypothetical protein